MLSVASALTWPAFGMPTIMPYCWSADGSDAVATGGDQEQGGKSCALEHENSLVECAPHRLVTHTYRKGRAARRRLGRTVACTK